MATQFTGINRGGQLVDVTTGTSTTSKAIELTVNDAVGITREEVKELTEILLQFISNLRTNPYK
jgi:hypothetical protein